MTGTRLGHRVAIYCPSADGQGNRLSGVANSPKKLHPRPQHRIGAVITQLMRENWFSYG
jgi:hypothetical protein